MSNFLNGRAKALARDLYHVYKVSRLHEPEFDGIVPYLTGEAMDIGANYGTFTYFLAKHSPRVIAIEPAPQNFRALTWVSNFYRLNAELIQAAVSDKDGIVKFEAGENLYEGRISENGSLSVPCVTVDSLNLSPSFIKIDVEGLDAQVLRGCLKTIERSHPALLVEVSCQETWQLLDSIGYACVANYGSNKLFLNNPVQRLDREALISAGRRF